MAFAILSLTKVSIIAKNKDNKVSVVVGIKEKYGARIGEIIMLTIKTVNVIT